MKLLIGGVPPYNDFNPDSSWNSFKGNDESLGKGQLNALPVALVSMTITVGLWFLLTAAESLFLNFSFRMSVLSFLISFISVLICHELIHMFFHPGAGFTENSTLGFCPSKMLLYAFYGKELSRNRYLLILLAPFLIISFGLLIFSVFSSYLTIWILYSSVLNSFVSSGDILFTFQILKLPSKSIIRFKGNDAYWKDKSYK